MNGKAFRVDTDLFFQALHEDVSDGLPDLRPWDGTRGMPLAVLCPGEALAADSVETKVRHVEYLRTRPGRDPGSSPDERETASILGLMNRWFDELRENAP